MLLCMCVDWLHCFDIYHVHRHAVRFAIHQLSSYLYTSSTLWGILSNWLSWILVIVFELINTKTIGRQENLLATSNISWFCCFGQLQYRMPDAYDQEGGVNQEKRFSVALQCYRYFWYSWTLNKSCWLTLFSYNAGILLLKKRWTHLLNRKHGRNTRLVISGGLCLFCLISFSLLLLILLSSYFRQSNS